MISLPQRRILPGLADLSSKLIPRSDPTCRKNDRIESAPNVPVPGTRWTRSWLPRRKQWGVAPVRVARAVPHRTGASATVDADRELAQVIIEA
jgi:hypothetical protein